MGREPLTILLVIAVTLTQITVAYLLRNTPVLSFKFLFVAYAVGGTLNQNAFLSIHDITHNLAFRGVGPNRLFAMFANLPIGVPFAMLFKRYHSEHHRVRVFPFRRGLRARADVANLESSSERMAWTLTFRQNSSSSSFTRLPGSSSSCAFPSSLCLSPVDPWRSPGSPELLPSGTCRTFQIFFYALRPGLVRHLPPTRWLALNILVQLTFDWLVVTHWGWHAMLYFLISSHMAGSLHPLAGHFIGEHFVSFWLASSSRRPPGLRIAWCRRRLYLSRFSWALTLG